MIRLSKLADYGIVLMTYFAPGSRRNPEHRTDKTAYTARDLAQLSGLPLPTVSKVLKALCRGGLLTSHRGVRGGYSLPRQPEEVSVVDIIRAVDGPIALTDCSEAASRYCDLEDACPVRSNWQKINRAVADALTGLRLTDMTTPRPPGYRMPTGSLGYVSLSSVREPQARCEACSPVAPEQTVDERGST